MRKGLLILLGLLIGLQCLAGGIVSGPWVSEARENSLTILWTTDVPGMGYVEFENGDRFWDTFAGRRIFPRFHSVHIEGLQPGEIVRYRIGGIDLADDRNARDPRFGDSWNAEWHSVRSFNAKATECHFSVFNDVHMRTQKYAALAMQVDSAATDFLFLNGDIVSAGNYGVDTLARYQIDPLGCLPSGLPVLFARGNHEGRGNGVEAVAKLFPNADPAPFYYSFRQGPAAFIVFDAGETHAKRSVAYCGSEVFEDYLNEQIAWAEKAMGEDSFRSAPVKVCILHVPMIDHPDKNDYLLQRWLNVHMVPMLNEAGIDLMIGADLHEFMYCEPGTMGNRFPIIVNDDARRLQVDISPFSISLKMQNYKAEVEFEKVLLL